MSEYEHTEHLIDEIERLREENFHLREVAEEQKQRIKRLQEAGDTMASAYRQICYDAYDDQQIDNWIKAKDEKP